jgi:hypothetical protein
MYTRDLLTAQIETFSKLLAALILKRKGQQYDQLEEDLLALIKHHLGVQTYEVLAMDEEEFKQVVLAADTLSPEKKKLLGWALQEHCELLLALDNTQLAKNSCFKAFVIYRYLLDEQNGIIYDLDLKFRFNSLKSLLEGLENG